MRGKPNSNRIGRRDVLKLVALGGATVVTLRYLQPARATAPRPQGKHQWAMVIDLSKCTGCGYCTLACRAHNDVPPNISWNEVSLVGELDDHPIYLPRPCMQCANAPCVEVCPVGASYYRADGIVMMDYDRCIGCRYCMIACPYDARAFNWESFRGPNPAVPTWGQPEVERRPRGVVEKCSFCYQRIDRGLALGLTPGLDAEATPACVVACPTKARLFGDLNDPDSPVTKALREHPTYRLREELGTQPRVYYIPPQLEKMEAGS